VDQKWGVSLVNIPICRHFNGAERHRRKIMVIYKKTHFLQTDNCLNFLLYLGAVKLRVMERSALELKSSRKNVSNGEKIPLSPGHDEISGTIREVEHILQITECLGHSVDTRSGTPWVRVWRGDGRREPTSHRVSDVSLLALGKSRSPAAFGSYLNLKEDDNPSLKA